VRVLCPLFPSPPPPSPSRFLNTQNAFGGRRRQLCCQKTKRQLWRRHGLPKVRTSASLQGGRKLGKAVLSRSGVPVFSSLSPLPSPVLPRHLAFYEDVLEKSPTQWLAGTASPTIADFLAAAVFNSLRNSNVVRLPVLSLRTLVFTVYLSHSLALIVNVNRSSRRPCWRGLVPCTTSQQ
jgi:hypothetical protein